MDRFNILEKAQNHQSCRLKIIKILLTVFTISIISLIFLAQTTFDGQSNYFGKLPELTNRALATPSQFSIPPELSAIQKNASTNATCSLTPSTTLSGTPQQIEGPYFVDGMPNRSDIRSDTSNGLVEQGIPLRLVFHVYGVSDDSCIPVKGAKVDIWHANSQGIYSAVENMETAENTFLRGYQMTDENGTAKFTTIYPGWYEGRAIHIHDKVRIFSGEQKTVEWTSQLYLNNSINEEIHAESPYSNHGSPKTSNEEDMIYSGASADGMTQKDSGERLMINIKQADSYLGTFDIVLNSSQQD